MKKQNLKGLRVKSPCRNVTGTYRWMTGRRKVCGPSLHSAQTWELSQKLVHDRYPTLWLLCFLYPDTSSLCWRDCHVVGTYKHIWRDCSKVAEFWSKLIAEISLVTKQTITPSSHLALLNLHTDIEWDSLNWRTQACLPPLNQKRSLSCFPSPQRLHNKLRSVSSFGEVAFMELQV